MNTLQTKWREYQAVAIPESASDRQIDAMRKAFYAGVAATLDLMAEITETAATESAQNRMLDAIYDECDAVAAVRN